MFKQLIPLKAGLHVLILDKISYFWMDTVYTVTKKNLSDMNIRPYVKIARTDHWTKNIFVLPGTIIVAFFLKIPPSQFAGDLIIGLFSTCMIASANYVINEWLDAKFDGFHPTKRLRPSVSGHLKAHNVYTEYAFLAIFGLAMASFVSKPFLLTSAAFLLMGIVYNVKPFRTKNIVILDVLSESVNNPIRLILGWFIVSSDVLPPSSLVISYWMGGAFLMAMKRFSELRSFPNREAAGAYRRSFKYYSEEKLLISSFFYAMSCAMFLGVFLVKYRIEFLLSFPFVAVLFSWYFHMSFRADSPAQCPERLHKERGFILYCILFVLLLMALLFIDIPMLKWFLINAFMAG